MKKSLHVCWTVVLLLSMGFLLLAPSPSLADPSYSAEVGAQEAYTWASSLNLRQTSTPGATILQNLSINTPLLVLASGSPMTRVRLRDGTVGWVGSAYIGDVPLTLKETEQQVQEAAGVPGDVLSWRQRAAALAPENLVVLQALARAYVENGEIGEANELARAHGFSLEMTLVATFDGCQQSDTQGVLYNFTDHQGPTGGYGPYNWHSFQESNALRGFCNDAMASPSKLGKRFRLTTDVVSTMMCAECCNQIGDCIEWYDTVRLEVKSILPDTTSVE